MLALGMFLLLMAMFSVFWGFIAFCDATVARS